MIERKIVAQKLKEFQIQDHISTILRHAGYSHSRLQRTPLGEKIIIYSSRPGMTVGRQGQNIKLLNSTIKRKFKMENPQIEIAEIEQIPLNAKITADRIASSLERFGSSRFKGIAHKVMQDAINAGALGIEIVISGESSEFTSKIMEILQWLPQKMWRYCINRS